MPIRDDPWPAGTPCWADIAFRDLPAAKEFYAAVLGWQYVETGEEFGNYNIAQVEGRAVAGMGPIMEEDWPTAWTMYLASDDTDATAKLITDNGGALLFEPMDIPGNGRMVVATDPSGAAFGVWQSLGMHGAGYFGGPGGLVWEDGRFTDPAAAKAFYAAVYGYTYGAVPGAPDDYQTFDLDGRPAGGMGGMMGAPEGTPAHWLMYFGVASADAAVAEVEGRGGTVLSPAADTPFGRMATVQDPWSAVFAIIEPSPGPA